MTTTVCIIDGDPAVRDSLATVVGLNGYQTLTFATGNEFLEQTAGLHECIVCEAELPDTTGLAIYQALQPHNPQMRFALLVSRTNLGVAAQANRLGINHVFFKPLVNRRLVAFVAGRDTPQT